MGVIGWAQPMLHEMLHDRVPRWLIWPERKWTATVAPRLVADVTATEAPPRSRSGAQGA